MLRFADNETTLRLIRTVDNWNPTLSLFLAFCLVVVIGVLDYVTGIELALSVFYLLPLAVLAWKGGRWLGLAGSVVCTAVWAVARAAAGQRFSSPFLLYWNIGSRFVSFELMAFLLSSLKSSYVYLESLSRTDPLTGCFNTRTFLDLLNTEIERSRRYKRPLTLAYFDLDNFKTVNDTFGHAAGDLVLKSVVVTLRSNIRVSDILGRLGGDEFALVLPETDREAALTALSKIRTGILQEMSAKDWPVTVSIGSVTCLETYLEPTEFMKRADDLLYQSKLNGKNRISSSSFPD